MSYIGKETGFIPSQPNTWPKYFENKSIFSKYISEIFFQTIIEEIEGVINDAKLANNGLGGRGHVVAIALFCAIDTLSSYGYKNLEQERCELCNRGDKVGPRYQKYIEEYFPKDYSMHAKRIYKSYRNASVHSWNLFDVAIWPGDEPIRADKFGVINVGLINFSKALRYSINCFIDKIKENDETYENAFSRYISLISIAN